MPYKPNISIKALLDAGVHFGHKKNLWNPKMDEYIYGVKNKVHIIDLQQTAAQLYSALKAIFAVTSNNGKILFVNIKKQSTEVVKAAAEKCGQYYVNHRWLGGMLTNWSTISSSIKTLKGYEDILTSKQKNYTKKELLDFTRKKEKLEKAIGGIRNLSSLPDILFVIDVKTHAIAVQEARKLKIPVFGIVDTNSSVNGIDFVIPGNDDSRKSIELYCNLVADAVIHGTMHNLPSEDIELKKASNTKEVSMNLIRQNKSQNKENAVLSKRNKDNNVNTIDVLNKR